MAVATRYLDSCRHRTGLVYRSLCIQLASFIGATDEVLLELLWGKFLPRGKLPFEMPRSMEAVRAQLEDLPYDSVDPLFSFGHGLRYPGDEAGVLH